LSTDIDVINDLLNHSALIIDSDIPVANDGISVTGLVHEDALSGANAEAGASPVQSVTATGSVSALFSVGADTSGTFSLLSDVSALVGLGLTSGGDPLSYNVSDDVLSATAGGRDIFTLDLDADGSYSFTLLDQVDHAADGNDDGQLLNIEFGSLVRLTDADGDFVDATGGFVISIEDDIPNVAPVLSTETTFVDEILINSETVNIQGEPIVSNLPNGGWVVTWVSLGQDDPLDVDEVFALGIYGQVYNADGTPLGGEFQVNTTVVGKQAEASITSLSNDGWVIVWESRGQDEPDNEGGLGIYGQAYNTDGTPLGGEFLVNTETEANQLNPSVTSLSNAGWVVTWDSPDDASTGIFGQAYNADGTPLRGEFQVNTNEDDLEGDPYISSLDGGGWVVIWQASEISGNVNNPGIFGRIYDADGAALSDNDFQINTTSNLIQGDTYVSGLDGGGWVAVWEGFDLAGDNFNVFGRAYDANGTALSEDDFLVNTKTAGDQRDPSTSGLVDGGWVITWTGTDSSGFGVYGQVYNADGTPRGGEFLVNTDTAGDQRDSSVTGLDDGGWVVTWTGPDSSLSGVYSKTFNADGSTRSYFDPGTGLQYYAYREGAPELIVFSDLSISDSDDLNLFSASVSVSDFVPGDILGLAEGFSLPSGIDVSYDPATGILSLTGSALQADYEATLEHVVYSSVTENPDVSGQNPTRTIVANINDGLNDSQVVSSTFTVIGLNVGTIVTGSTSDESLNGTSRDDLIEGGGGEDTLTGGLGADVFRFGVGESGNDVIADFSLAQGDILHLGGLLNGEENNSLDNYLSFAEVGGNTVISVDTNGDGSGTDQTITLTGVDLTNGGTLSTDIDVINDLLNHSALIIDSDIPVVNEGVSVTGLVHEDALVGGNAEVGNTPTQTLVASGSVASLFSVGADTSGTFSLLSDVNTLEGFELTSGGEALNYSVSDDVLSATADGRDIFTLDLNADGSYSFTLLDQVDHALGGNDDAQTLDIDFGSLVRLTDADGDFVDATGTFVISIEDDIPTVVPVLSTETTDEIQVNTVTLNDQSAPSVTGLSNGGWVVTWESDGQDGDLFGIYGQAYNADGTARGTEFLVNTATAGDQRDPSVTGLSNGGWVVTWEIANDPFTAFGITIGLGLGIYGQAYNADGTRQGIEFQVNTETEASHTAPSVTDLSDGGWVVTWERFVTDGDNSFNIRGQAYNADGTARGTEFLVNTVTSNFQNASSVTGLSDGGWVVTWQSLGQDLSGDGIFGQVYNQNGTPQGTEFLVNTVTSNNQSNPSVTGLSDGGWVVTWQSQAQDLSGDGIYGQVYNENGTPQGTEFLVNTVTSNNQSNPSVTGLSDGGWIVTWQSFGQDDAENGIYSKTFNEDGSVRSFSIPGTPVANDGISVTGLVHEDALSGANAESESTSAQTLVASGSIASLFSVGADTSGTFSLLSDVSALEDLGLTSDGEPLGYSVSDDVLIATAGGRDIFTLDLD
ncbi:T1SS-143 repeat domain-containing protein, partial [Halopseudomonas sp.]|uniref:T1SS-143 repeat domain-containing protein n=1 Tax=Halopseudomonas sp. TaxID=2901191 RepID=UPI003001B823